jgi:phenylacetate-CoA ligase
MKTTFKSYINFHLKYNTLFKDELRLIKKLAEACDLESQKNEMFIKQFKKALKHHPFYKNYYQTFGVNLSQILDISDIHKLPVITRTDLQLNAETIRDQRKRILVKKAYTSGTTGTPLVLYRDWKSIIKENAYVWWYRTMNGLQIRDPKISIRGDLDRNELFYLDRSSNTLFISSFNLNTKTYGLIINKIKSFQAKALIAYPSSMHSLCLLLEQFEDDLSIPLTFTSSEKLLSNQIKMATKHLKTKIFDWYGNAERSIALYKLNNKYYEPPLYSINEYGEDMITTSLINSYFPLIRYKVNDVVELDEDPKKFNSAPTINRIDGRIEDFIILKDGTRIGRMDLVFKGVHNLYQAQIIQNDVNEILVNIIVASNYHFSDEKQLLHNLRSKVGNDIKIKINIVTENDLIYSESGKFSLVKSNVHN